MTEDFRKSLGQLVWTRSRKLRSRLCEGEKIFLGEPREELSPGERRGRRVTSSDKELRQGAALLGCAKLPCRDMSQQVQK